MAPRAEAGVVGAGSPESRAVAVDGAAVAVALGVGRRNVCADRVDGRRAIGTDPPAAADHPPNAAAAAAGSSAKAADREAAASADSLGWAPSHGVEAPVFLTLFAPVGPSAYSPPLPS